MKTILFFLISFVLSGCTSLPSIIPVHNVAAKIAVDRATFETIDTHGRISVKKAVAKGYDHLDLSPAGNYLLYAIDKHNKVLQKLSGHKKNGLGLPRFLEGDYVETDRIMAWVEAKL